MKLTNEDRSMIAEDLRLTRQGQTVSDWLLMWGWIFLAIALGALILYGLYLYFAIPLGWRDAIWVARGGTLP